MLEWVALWRACMDSVLAWVACLRGWRACACVTVIIEILP